MPPRLRRSLVGFVGFVGFLGFLGCASPMAASDDLQGTDESSSETTDAPDPDLPPESEELLGDNCSVEVLWSSNEVVLTDFVLGEPGEFFLAGSIYFDSEQFMAQVTLRVADGELDWSDTFATTETTNGWGPTGPKARRVIQGPDAVWVFGHHPHADRAWITAYSPTGELLWESSWSNIYWLDVASAGDSVFATAMLSGSPYQGIIHRLEGQGASSWSFQLDGLLVFPNGVAVRGDDLWVVGGHHQVNTDCAWRAHWTLDGQLSSMDCLLDATDDRGDAYNDVLILADGTRVIGGRNNIRKPNNVGHITYSEPLVAILDEAGIEQARWTYGPGIYWGGAVLDMAELPTGGFVMVSRERDSSQELAPDRPTIHRFSADIQHLARCQLDRPGADNYEGVLERVEVGPDGQIHALLREWDGSSLVRITGLGD